MCGVRLAVAVGGRRELEISRQWRRLVSANVYRRGAVTVTIYLSRITRAALVAGELWNIRVAAMRHISYTIIARINRDAATQQRHRLRRPAVVGNRSEVQRRGRGVEQIAGGRRDSGTACVADQVVPLRGERAIDIRAGRSSVLGDDGIAALHCAAVVVNAAAEVVAAARRIA